MWLQPSTKCRTTVDEPKLRRQTVPHSRSRDGKDTIGSKIVAGVHLYKSSQVAFNENKWQSHKYYMQIDINGNKIAKTSNIKF